MKWLNCTLGELINIKHGYAFKSKFFDNAGKYILLTPGNCDDKGGLKLKGDKEKYYVGKVPQDFILRDRDLLVVMTDLVQAAPILGGAFLIPEDDKFLHNQRLGLINIKNESFLNKKYLFYVLNTNIYRSQVRASATGTTVKHTAPERIYKCTIPIPDIKIQVKIANILSKYDDLIENNRRRIELLEESARSLYREWFVYLRFPVHEHAPIIDGVPQGWEEKPLSELCIDIRESINPQNVPSATPYIGLEHIPRRSITLGEWSTADRVESTKFKFQKSDILFGKIRPYFHKVSFTLLEGITSSDAIVIRPYEKLHYFYCLMLLSSDSFIKLASKTMKEGSKMPRADWSYLIKYQFIVPPKILLESFNSYINPIINQLENLAFQNIQLSQARDILLPRLMNGEIAV